MALAGAGRPQQVDDLAARDEVQLDKRQDAGFVERWLKREVVSGEGFDGVEAAHAQSGPDPPIFTERQLLKQQLFDQLYPGDLAAIEAGDAGVDDLDGTRHFEADHTDLDTINEGLCRIGKK